MTEPTSANRDQPAPWLVRTTRDLSISPVLWTFLSGAVPLIASKMMKSGSAFVGQRAFEMATTLDHSRFPSWESIEATGLISRLEAGSPCGFIENEAGGRVGVAGEFALDLESGIAHTVPRPCVLPTTTSVLPTTTSTPSRAHIAVHRSLGCVGDSGLSLATSQTLSPHDLAELLRPDNDVWAAFGQRRHIWRRFVAITGAGNLPVSAKILMATVGITRTRAFDAMKAVVEMEGSPVCRGTFYGEVLGNGSSQSKVAVRIKSAEDARKAHREMLMGDRAEYVWDSKDGPLRLFKNVYRNRADEALAAAEKAVSEAVLAKSRADDPWWNGTGGLLDRRAKVMA